MDINDDLAVKNAIFVGSICQTGRYSLLENANNTTGYGITGNARRFQYPSAFYIRMISIVSKEQTIKNKGDWIVVPNTIKAPLDAYNEE